MKNKQNKPRRRRIDVNVEELDQIVDRAREAPLSDTDYDKLKTALHALIEKLLGLKKSEKLASVFGDDKTPASPPAPRQRKERRGTGATARTPSAARARSRSRIRSWLRAIAARTAAAAKSTCTRSPRLWLGSWGRRRWPQPSMNCSGCAAMPVGRSSRPRS